MTIDDSESTTWASQTRKRLMTPSPPSAGVKVIFYLVIVALITLASFAEYFAESPRRLHHLLMVFAATAFFIPITTVLMYLLLKRSRDILGETLCGIIMGIDNAIVAMGRFPNIWTAISTAAAGIILMAFWGIFIKIVFENILASINGSRKRSSRLFNFSYMGLAGVLIFGLWYAKSDKEDYSRMVCTLFGFNEGHLLFGVIPPPLAGAAVGFFIGYRFVNYEYHFDLP